MNPIIPYNAAGPTISVLVRKIILKITRKTLTIYRNKSRLLESRFTFMAI